MPPSRHQLPPQTSKKARRAYLGSKKHFEFTPTQQRASERRLELEKRAKALQTKEQRKKDNKRKREEKEASEREAKRKRIELGKAPPESLWGKARASQRRLNAFFAKPNAADKNLGDHSQSEDDERLEQGYDPGEEIGGNSVQQGACDPPAETEGLEGFFSSAASVNSIYMAQPLASDAADLPAQPGAVDLAVQAHSSTNSTSSHPEDPNQTLLDAQLSLSQIFDFEIAEDDDAEWLPVEIEGVNRSNSVQDQNIQNRLLATPSKRKADIGDFEFASPSKSVRSALSEMSPSKVNTRAQEKPDIFSVAPFSSKLPTPSPAKQQGSQTAAQVLAMIATQDLEDDGFLTDKENEDPFQCESKRRPQQGDEVRKKTSHSGGEMKHDLPHSRDPAEKVQAPNSSFGDDILTDDDFAALESGLEDEQDDYDNDLDDEALAALAAQSPSAHKLALMSSKNAQTMAGRGAEAKQVVTTTDIQVHTQAAKGMPHHMQAVSNKAQANSPGRRRQLSPITQGSSFAFDDVPDDELTSLVEEYDMVYTTANQEIRRESKPDRTLP